MKAKKRLVSLLLAACLWAGLLPAAALAAGAEADTGVSTAAGSGEPTVKKEEQSAPYGTFSTAGSTENSVYVTFTDVTQTENKNGIEIAYAVGPAASEPTSNWTTAARSGTGRIYSATIGQLSPGTPYVFFARYKGDDTYEPSPAFASNFARYTNPKILTQGLPNAYVGVEYSQKLEAVAAEGVALKWAIYNGSLPAGLTLNSDGTITGSPTAPTTQAVSIAVTATAGEGTGSAISKQDLTISVTKSDADLGDLTVTGQTGFEGHFQYGDTITVTFTPQRKADTSTNALAENTATLTYTPAEGDPIQLAEATEEEDGTFTLTYDTKEKKLPIGEDLTLTVSYGGSSEFNPVEETVSLTLDKAILMNIPAVTGDFMFSETLTVNYTKQDDETVTYQWYRGGERISNALESSYTLTAEDIGKNIYVEVVATDEWHRGAMQSRQQMVAKAEQPAPETGAGADGFTVNYTGESITAAEGYELSADKEAVSAGPLTVTPGTTVYVRAKETDTHTASEWAEITIPARPAAPVAVGVAETSVGSNDGKITGLTPNTAYELMLLNARAGWRQQTADETGALTGLAPGTYRVRLAATATAFAGQPATVTVAAHTCTADGSGWHKDETGHWQVCACGERLGVAEHNFAWVTDKAATATEDGSKHEECMVCHYAKAAVAIPATGQPASPAPVVTPSPAPTATPIPAVTLPQTGDDFPLGLCIVLLAASGVGLAALLVWRRRW